MKVIKKALTVDVAYWNGTKSGADAILAEFPQLHSIGLMSQGETVLSWILQVPDGQVTVHPDSFIVLDKHLTYVVKQKHFADLFGLDPVKE